MLGSKRHWFRDLSLARKLTVLATATTAVSMMALCALLGWHDTVELRARLVSDSEILVDMVAASSRGALAFSDAQAASETLQTLAVNRQIAAATVLLPDRHVLASYARDNQNTSAPAPASLAHVLQQDSPWHGFVDDRLALGRRVMLDGEPVGAVYVEVDLSELRARLSTLWRWLAFALAATVLLACAIAWRLQRVISTPLLRLTEITRDVIRDRNYSVRAESTSRDEVGELVKGFNEMLADIQQRDARLESHRQELERTVTDRTAELKASVDRFRMLVESTHAVPWELDSDTWETLYVSPQVIHLIGYEAETLTNRVDWITVVHPDDRVRVEQQFRALAGEPRGELDLEYRLLSASNTTVDVRSMVTAHRRADGSVVLRGITLDITQQKRMEFELRQAQKLESVGRLAAGVAHEINTPVQFVSDSVHFVRGAMNDLATVLDAHRDFQRAAEGAVAAEAMERVQAVEVDADLEYLMENVPRALDRAVDGLNRVATIVRSMKEFAHPDQKEMTAVDLNKAIQSTLAIARNEYKYVADVETQLGDIPAVTCLGGDINQAVLNIVVNAAHAVESVVKDTDQRGRIAVSTALVGANVEIRISDTGPGIPVDVRERIFDPFFTTKEVGKGTGQGLPIVRSVIVEKHGGEVTFETELGVGTTFIIRLPIDGRTRREEVAA